MREVIQTLMAMLGTICFSMLFNVRGKKLFAAAGGAVISWLVYLFTFRVYGDKVLSLLCGTIAVSLIAEILARVVKSPVTVLLVPMLIPLFPGSDLFYATSHVVQNLEESNAYVNLVVKEAGAMAFGILLVTCIVQVVLKVAGYVKRHFV